MIILKCKDSKECAENYTAGKLSSGQKPMHLR